MTRPIRVLQFITPAGFYGAERWVLALANNQPAGAMECELAVTQEGGDQDLSVATEFEAMGGRVHYLPMKHRFDRAVIAQLVAILKNRQIDVIHTHGYKSDILGVLAAKRAGVRCVSTPHGFSGNVGFKLAAFIRLGIFSLRYFDAVAPLSEELVADMKRFGVPKRRTHFIRNGVDLKDIDATLSQAGGRLDQAPDNGQTIGFIGQMIPRKGIGDLIDAFASLQQSHPNTRLSLVGDGHQRPELERRAGESGYGHRIAFLGFRADRLLLLKTFDLFVMTSSLEGIPRCLMEAMAVGVPCVAYDIPGVDQLIDHEQTGLLVPFGDKVALRAACQRLLDDPELSARLAANARAKVERDYSAQRMAVEYQQLFEGLLADGRSATAAGEWR
ncbi:glycosyltransferase family 4 protein [Marinobacter sp. C2H3]|uniref:glycosyltransferase family 4 protein n=1 Tax=Marinobacter sp. C2H3 TaxID=3119003 RepID=UPI00300EB11C